MQIGDCDTLASCQAALDEANRRVNKTLDALDHAIAVAASKDVEIQAYKTLSDLKDQWLKIKDGIISAQAELIKFYQSKDKKSKFKQIIEKIEKILVFAAGVYIGKGL